LPTPPSQHPLQVRRFADFSEGENKQNYTKGEATNNPRPIQVQDKEDSARTNHKTT